MQKSVCAEKTGERETRTDAQSGRRSRTKRHARRFRSRPRRSVRARSAAEERPTRETRGGEKAETDQPTTRARRRGESQQSR